LAILVVGGNGKDVGKTALVCAVISSLREFHWTAVKITGHDYGPVEDQGTAPQLTIREETCAGQETDTARYLAAGARRALLVTRTGDQLPVVEIRIALGEDRNVIFESNRIVDVVTPDVCLALMGGRERKASFERLLQMADAIVTVQKSLQGALPEGIQRFELNSADRLSAEMTAWLRDRLTEAVA